MKMLVDKMPDKPQQCLFSSRDICGYTCMLLNHTCYDVKDCKYLKVRKDNIHVGSSFLPEYKRAPCSCGSDDNEICKVGNAFASLYYIKCNSCGYETEQFPTVKEASDDWNKDRDVKPYTPYDYQTAAGRTMDYMLSTNGRLLEGLVGINSEAGEALDIWKKYEFHKHDLDAKAIALELGDVLWYLTEAAVALGYSLEDIMKMNIEKLSKRYPDGFDPERSKNREE